MKARLAGYGLKTPTYLYLLCVSLLDQVDGKLLLGVPETAVTIHITSPVIIDKILVDVLPTAGYGPDRLDRLRYTVHNRNDCLQPHSISFVKQTCSLLCTRVQLTSHARTESDRTNMEQSEKRRCDLARYAEVLPSI